ncbi:hypothetical protein [Listeria floridensis]|uniref:hypothetical protein n=1 Tax=Listeria floridensis TaxID=1494962 RepID=UPI0004B80B83|nr:hypothetical protein [Listeria floridensis]
MAKIADEYFKLDPWKIIEEGFDPAYNEVAESVFSLGNEYMGVRGYFEEGTTAPSLQGSYFNGIYERDHAETGLNYKGIVSKTHFMVNAVDSFYTKLELDGEMLDMNQIQMENFKRELNLKTGELSRTLTWITHSGKRLKITFERFLHMENYTEAFQKITFEPENFSGAIKVTVGQNFGTTHGSNDAKYWNTTEKGFTEKGAYIVSDTTSSNQRVFSGFELEVSREIVCERLETEKFVGYTFDFPLEKAQQDSLTKYITNLAEKNISLAEAEFVQKGHSNLSKQHECGYEAAKASQQAFWENVWAKFDIKIDGDLKNQQGIRYCIFQLQQTYHGQDPTNNIGAKGLTGEAYNGHAFWDTETCCLPYYLFTNLKAAKNLLEFRYSTLAEAKNSSAAIRLRRSLLSNCNAKW